MNARTLRTVLLVFLAAQVLILVAEHADFFSELFRFRSRLGGGLPAGAGSSLPLLLATLGAAALWACRPWSWERFAAAGLAMFAAVSLAVYAAALASGRLFAWLPWVVLALSAALAVSALRSRPAAPEVRTPFSPFDALSALFLSTLVVPAVFPYIAYDASLIWAWRAYALRDEGFAFAVTRVLRPDYPPLDSILLWLGAGDPLFEGRFLPVVLLVLFAVFFRARLARIAPALAPAGLLFLVATVHVWRGLATYYADVPLMIFLVAGSLLALGVPRSGEGKASVFDRAAGALCLAAAALVRPDGGVCLGIVACAALWREREPARRSFVPAAVACAAWASWAFRPASLRPAASGFLFSGSQWREAGATAADAVRAVSDTFFFSLQGQWLSHKGLGAAVYLVAVIAAQRALTRASRVEGPGESETRFFGAVTFLSLGAVAFIYAVLPFTSDIRAGVAPNVYPTWEASFRNFANVGIGRMTVHLLPFFVLYATRTFAFASSRRSPRGTLLR
jgi:hypothetical protein